MEKLKIILLAISILTITKTYSQNDTIIFNNGDIVVGEVKGMDQGVLSIETGYSDSDFQISWSEIEYINTSTIFVITTTDGIRYDGSIKSYSKDTISIVTEFWGNIDYSKEEIVLLNAIDVDFWSRLSASIDIGYSLSKASNLQQFSTRSNIGYMAERWSTDITYNQNSSLQDSVEDILRRDATLNYNYYLPKDWYIILNTSLLSNTEQKIDLRSSTLGGLGLFVIHTNKSYWGFQVGASYMYERFSTDEPDKSSVEAFGGSELHLFNYDDISLYTKIMVYPSITEKGRLRTDFNIDLKYDLPRDFYIKLGFSLNYDNQPVEGASELDYIFQTSVGWEL